MQVPFCDSQRKKCPWSDGLQGHHHRAVGLGQAGLGPVLALAVMILIPALLLGVITICLLDLPRRNHGQVVGGIGTLTTAG